MSIKAKGGAAKAQGQPEGTSRDVSRDVVSASELKARCSEVIERVATERHVVTVTKRGKPVARIVPLESTATTTLIGYARGRLTVTGDLLAPIDVEWEAAR
jgi:prevent-host-death family protein